MGSSKRSIIAQFCLENGILVFVSFLISVGLFLLVLLPKMNDIFGAEFGKITFNIENDYPVPLYAIGLGLLVTLIVGVIPILRYISVPITTGIKGKIESIRSNFFFRNAFITLQFAIAIFFICVAIILNNQVDFMKNAELGFNRENVIVGNIDLDYKDLKMAGSQFNALLDELNTNPYVKNVSVSEAVPSQYNFNYSNFYDPDAQRNIRTRYSNCDEGYLKTFEIPVVIGRDFDENLDGAGGNSVIINRSAMKALGWNTIEGKRLKRKNDSTLGHLVVGVMEDFHYQDMQNGIEPLMHLYRDKKDLSAHRFLSLRVIEGQEKAIKDIMTSSFAKMDSRRNYENAYLSDKVSGQYRLIDGMLKTVNIVALLTIFISCLGMFGLISFMAQRRIKEIGIRKVLGASVFKIIILLSKDYIIILGIAALIAFPISWSFMRTWLASFAYSVTIQWWMFALGGLMAFLITSFTLGIQAVKSANANPIKSLRTD